MSTKKCSKCGEVKNFSEFYSRKKSLDGLRCNCKSCDSVYNKNRTSNNLLIPIDLTVKFKKCSICQITLNIIYFSKNRTTKDGYSYHCKKCHREDF